MNRPKHRWRNEEVWVRWENRAIDGQDYCFSHLLEFDMLLQRPARGNDPPLLVPIRVVFDCHVVTEEDLTVVPKGIANDPAYWVDTGDVCRKFDVTRYGLSLDLPDLLRQLPNGQTKCYLGGNDNYMVCQRINQAGDIEFYQVYFDLYRPHGQDRLVMYVQSAYVKDNPIAADRDHVKVFATICAEKMGLIQKKPKGPRNKAKKKTK